MPVPGKRCGGTRRDAFDRSCWICRLVRGPGGCNEYVGLDRRYVSLMGTLIATKLIREEVIEFTECKKYRDGVSGTTRSRGDYRFE